MRATVVFVTVLLVVGAGAPLAAAGSVVDAPEAASQSVAAQEDDAGNESANETAPGARLAGVAEVQGAEVEGEVQQRSFGLQVAAANSNASKASVVASHVRNLDQRLADLREQKAALEAAYENGSVSESRYRARVAGLAARISAVERLANETAETAEGLPAEELEAKGVNASAIQRLQSSARNLSGPEVAAIARDIAGGPPNGSVGPPAGAGDGPPFGDDNTTAGPGNGGGPGNQTGGPGDAPGAGNGTAGGPGETPGQANGTQGTQGPPGQNGSVGGDGAPGGSDTTTGAPGNDTGTPGNDTGTPNNDTGTPGNDTGAPGNDTGTPGSAGGTAGNGSDTPGSAGGPAGNGSDTPGNGTDLNSALAAPLVDAAAVGLPVGGGNWAAVGV